MDGQQEYENPQAVPDFGHASPKRHERSDGLEKANGKPVGRIGQGDGIGRVRGQPPQPRGGKQEAPQQDARGLVGKKLRIVGWKRSNGSIGGVGSTVLDDVDIFRALG